MIYKKVSINAVFLIICAVSGSAGRLDEELPAVRSLLSSSLKAGLCVTESGPRFSGERFDSLLNLRRIGKKTKQRLKEVNKDSKAAKPSLVTGCSVHA